MELFLGAFTEEWERRKAADTHARKRRKALQLIWEEEEKHRSGGGSGGGASKSNPIKISFKSPAAFPRPSKPVKFDRPQTVRMEGLASGSQPAVVKMASYGGGSRLASMVNYVSREGELKLENHLGQEISGRDELREIRSDWQNLMSNRTESRDIAGFSLEISGYDASCNHDDLAVEALTAGLGDRHFVYSVEPNRKGGLTVSGVAVLRNSAGERLTADAKANSIVADRLKAHSDNHSLDLSFRFRGYGNGVEYGSMKVRELVANTGSAVKNEHGQSISSYAEAGDLVQKNWRSDLHSRQGRDVMHVIMSARAGTDIDAFRSSVRDFLSEQFGGHKYVFAVHDEETDTKEASAGGKRPHVHAHAIVTMKSEAGLRIATSPQTFRQWREVMAEKARDNGIRMEMSDRRETASAPAYSAKQVRPVYSNDNAERTQHEPTSASAAVRYFNKRENVSHIANTTHSRTYALKAALNWQRVAVANADTQIAVNSQQFCTKIIDAVLDIQTDQTGKVIAFNPDYSAAKGIATVMSLAQEADEMPSMNRQEFEAYEKVAEQSIHKVEQIIPEDNRQEYEEVIALARQTIDAERDLMLFHEAEAERTKSMNHITRSVESEFAEYFEQDIAQDAASEKRKDMEVSEIQSPEERDTDTVLVAAQDHASEQGEDDKKRHGYPDEVKQHYYVRSEREGEQHRVFYDHKGEREMFVDNGERLRSKQFDAHGVRIMVETAAHRGWTSIDVSGSAEFRREAWIEAQAHGINAKGYKPTEMDWQEVERREGAYLKNEISNSEREVKHTSEQSKEVSGAKVHGEAEAKQQPEKDARISYTDGVEGKLLESGVKPYNNDPKNEQSPFVVIETKQGEKTIWGVGIPDAMARAGVQVGDKINLREDGTEKVNKPIIKEVDGRKVRETIEVDRRAWKAEVLERPEVKIEQAPAKEKAHTSEVSQADKHRAMVDTQTLMKQAETVKTDPPEQHVNRAEDMGWNHSKDTEYDR